MSISVLLQLAYLAGVRDGLARAEEMVGSIVRFPPALPKEPEPRIEIREVERGVPARTGHRRGPKR